MLPTCTCLGYNNSQVSRIWGRLWQKGHFQSLDLRPWWSQVGTEMPRCIIHRPEPCKNHGHLHWRQTNRFCNLLERFCNMRNKNYKRGIETRKEANRPESKLCADRQTWQLGELSHTATTENKEEQIHLIWFSQAQEETIYPESGTLWHCQYHYSSQQGLAVPQEKQVYSCKDLFWSRWINRCPQSWKCKWIDDKLFSFTHSFICQSLTPNFRFIYRSSVYTHLDQYLSNETTLYTLHTFFLILSLLFRNIYKTEIFQISTISCITWEFIHLYIQGRLI